MIAFGLPGLGELYIILFLLIGGAIGVLLLVLRSNRRGSRVEELERRVAELEEQG